jgi:low molecular weight protein-tyrosine phosphatase
MYNLLFLCTGNYYRSRFAELLFNALAPAHNLPWQAFSRGVALEMGLGNVGPMNPLALQTLQALGITSAGFGRYPMQVQEDDFRDAQIIIALHEAEHRPYLHTRYPAWVDRVEYWHVRDCVPMPTYDPLQEITRAVQQLLARLSTSCTRLSSRLSVPGQ